MHVQVTIVPREKFPLGQTVVQVNEQRENTRQFTRRYLEEQLITVLAGASLGILAGQCPRCFMTSGITTNLSLCSISCHSVASAGTYACLGIRMCIHVDGCVHVYPC